MDEKDRQRSWIRFLKPPTERRVTSILHYVEHCPCLWGKRRHCFPPFLVNMRLKGAPSWFPWCLVWPGTAVIWQRFHPLSTCCTYSYSQYPQKLILIQNSLLDVKHGIFSLDKSRIYLLNHSKKGQLLRYDLGFHNNLILYAFSHLGIKIPQRNLASFSRSRLLCRCLWDS